MHFLWLELSSFVHRFFSTVCTSTCHVFMSCPREARPSGRWQAFPSPSRKAALSPSLPTRMRRYGTLSLSLFNVLSFSFSSLSLRTSLISVNAYQNLSQLFGLLATVIAGKRFLPRLFFFSSLLFFFSSTKITALKIQYNPFAKAFLDAKEPRK